MCLKRTLIVVYILLLGQYFQANAQIISLKKGKSQDSIKIGKVNWTVQEVIVKKDTNLYYFTDWDNQIYARKIQLEKRRNFRLEYYNQDSIMYLSQTYLGKKRKIINRELIGDDPEAILFSSIDSVFDENGVFKSVTKRDKNGM
ncbi:MAG: hypothetical protein H6607_10490 [Flavobacteriales bacterium]|nr:hypothetical protein [Flavobacteriales bacterium]